MFIDRRPRKDDAWLMLKVWSFILGAGLAVVGMTLELGWLVWVAIAVLAMGFVARFLPTEDGEAEAEDPAVVEVEGPP